jgi:hypothetical protein
MNWNRIRGNWKQGLVAGRRDLLAGKIQKRHGLARDEAQKPLAQGQREVTEGTGPQPGDDGAKSSVDLTPAFVDTQATWKSR